jgi:hypothetical protein
MTALAWGWKRGRSPYRKLKQPDYAAIAYGDVKDDVVIPKRKADVRPPPHLHTSHGFHKLTLTLSCP